MKQNSRFRHESMQDRNSIKDLLKAVTNGISRGKITLEDDSGVLTMEPAELLHLKITASVEDERNKLDIRIIWQGERDVLKGKSIKVK